jgi:hypothetical protein
MTRTGRLEQGLEEWSCTQCSRRLLLRRPPEFEKIVLERGDEGAVHVGGTGGLQPVAMNARPAEPGSLRDQDRTWLSEHGMDWGPDGTP